MNKYQEETKEFINKWEERSREFIHSFLDRFGNSTNMIKNQVQRAISPNPGTQSDNTSNSSPKKKSSLPFSFSFSDYRKKFLPSLRQSRREKRRGSISNSLSANSHNDLSELAHSNGDNGHAVLPSKRSKPTYNNNEFISDDSSEDEASNLEDERKNRRRTLKEKSQVQKNSQIMTRQGKKDQVFAKSFQDVDDEVDNQIPLI